jgi:hypothetical protein
VIHFRYSRALDPTLVTSRSGCPSLHGSLASATCFLASTSWANLKHMKKPADEQKTTLVSLGSTQEHRRRNGGGLARAGETTAAVGHRRNGWRRPSSSVGRTAEEDDGP